MASKCINLSNKERELIRFAVRYRQNFIRKKGEEKAVEDYEKILRKVK
jgi:hypothetical protein